MNDIQKLEELAKHATPGPWAVASDWSRYAVYQKATPHKRVVCTGNQNNNDLWVNAPWSGCDSRDADFIAAANPAALLELTAELKSLREIVEWDGVSKVDIPFGPLCALMDERDQLKAEIERLQRFETAYKEFSDKTDWVRPNAATHELGMHVAEVIRKRCEDLTSHNQAQAEEIVRLREQVRAFTASAYPVSTEINERGYNWCQAWLDEALAMTKEPRP